MTTNLPDPPSSPAVEIRRSRRRKRTVSAYREGERTVVLLPAGMRRADEQRWIDEMLRRLAAKEPGRRSDADLMRRARTLSARHFDGVARPASVRWVDNQNSRWGSCTPADRTIRLSRRLDGMPDWVVDYVLVHELAHLVEPAHNERFWSLVARYPRSERAMGYLEGVTAARASPARDEDVPETAEVDTGADP